MATGKDASKTKSPAALLKKSSTSPGITPKRSASPGSTPKRSASPGSTPKKSISPGSALKKSPKSAIDASVLKPWMVISSLGRYEEEGAKLFVWTTLEPVTSFTPLVLQQMSRIGMLPAQVKSVMERMRNCAQRNELFRGDRLVPSAVGMVSDRALFVQALRDCSEACFDNLEPLSTYTNELITLQETIEKAHEVFLRQVVLYCIKPLQKFIEEDCVRLPREFEIVEKARDAYDKERRRSRPLFGTAPHETVPPSPKEIEMKQKLIEIATPMAEMVAHMPQREVQLMQYVDAYVRAEVGFYNAVQNYTQRMSGPDQRKRWTSILR